MRIREAAEVVEIALWRGCLAVACFVVACLWWLGIICRAAVLLGVATVQWVRHRPRPDPPGMDDRPIENESLTCERTETLPRDFQPPQERYYGRHMAGACYGQTTKEKE